jgi:hypothetical protein
MILFTSDERRLRSLRRHSDALIGWGDLVTGGLRVYDIPGRHRDMFLAPNVEITSRALSTELRDAQA